MELTFWAIASAIEAENDWKQWDDFTITGIEFDSRKIQAGNLFVPLAGTNDGHTFVKEAMKKGASVTLWSSSAEVPKDISVLRVPNSLKAMQTLASYYLKKINPMVIAITGSNGKTSTKDMTESVVSQRFKTYKTQGNYNNEIGLPYTILHMPIDTEKLIVEMGMDHADEIAFLSRLASPTIAAITMIGEAHIENLGSRVGIAQAKMEIVTGLCPTGLLIVPSEEPLLESLMKELPQTVQTFGLKSGDYQATITKETKTATFFTVNGFARTFMIPISGKYNISNALIAFSIGCYLGLSEKEIDQGLQTFQLTANRTQWLKTKENVELLSDVYNANPTATKLVLENFAQLPTSGRRIAVLADMLELGEQSKAMHEALSTSLEAVEIEKVCLYGKEMKFLYDKLLNYYPKNSLYYFKEKEKNALITTIKNISCAGDMIVLKGSNGMGLQEVVNRLME